jgi:chromosome segregation ATPase
MSWIADLVKEMRALGVHKEHLSLLTFKLGETEKQFAILEKENLSLKKENDGLQSRLSEAQIQIKQLEENINVIEREKNQLQAELYKTRELPHLNLPDEIPEPEQTQETLSGFISDSRSRERLEAALIKIRSIETKEEYQIASNNNGGFEIPLLFGEYTVTISLAGYLPITIHCDIRKGVGYYVNFAKMVKIPQREE